MDECGVANRGETSPTASRADLPPGATKAQEWKKVRNLQNLLARSYYNKLLAIRRVTEQNQGKKTPGIDGTLYDTPEKRWELSKEQLVCRTYHPQPVKRVYIPKADGSNRPLGIPTLKDRVMQAMVKAALEPEWEARFEPNSYGFRPGRCTMDAIEQIWNTLHRPGSSPWILDADISKCFDHIAHESLLQRIPVFKRIIYRWLKAGVVELGQYHRTDCGTPQGGIISPLLANIALNGMERLFGAESKQGHYITPAKRTGLNKGISLIRYADDFIVTAPSKAILLTYVLPKLQDFLKERGLNLNSAKTQIVHRTEGFNFLGFTIRYFKRQKQFALFTKPQKEKVLGHLKQIKRILTQNKQVKTETLLTRLNPVLRGWANYYRYAVAKKTFEYITHRSFQRIWKWIARRHPRKSVKWRKARYYKQKGNRDWIFGTETRTLFNPTAIRIRRFVKVKGYASPYDPTLRTYWANRNRTRTLDQAKSKQIQLLLRRQKGNCGRCGLIIQPDDNYHRHHIILQNQGGSDKVDNLLLVHIHCHHQTYGQTGSKGAQGSSRVR